MPGAAAPGSKTMETQHVKTVPRETENHDRANFFLFYAYVDVFKRKLSAVNLAFCQPRGPETGRHGSMALSYVTD